MFHCHQKLKDDISNLKAKVLQWECTHILGEFREEVEAILLKLMATSIYVGVNFHNVY